VLQQNVKLNPFMERRNVEETELRMGAEDFAFYSHKIPLVFSGWVHAMFQKALLLVAIHRLLMWMKMRSKSALGVMALLGATMPNNCIN
jgi:metal-dependent amidase/aminoacylase/carboxypeptidase family protein